MGRCKSVWGLLLLVPASLAVAGPPYQTDDPDPVDYHHFEFFTAWTQTRAGNDTMGSVPQLALNYGAAPGLQLSATLPYAFNEPAEGHGSSGPGDFLYGAKYRLMEETADRPTLSVYPQVQTGNGNASRDLGAGGTQYLLPVWLQKNWGPWQVNGGSGYWLSRAPGTRSHWFSGVQVQKAVTPDWTLGAEIFHNSEMTPDQGSSTGFSLGVVHDMDEHNHLMLSLGRGLVHAETTNQGTVFAAYLRTW